MTEESWTTFSFQGHRKRRAEAACVHCHAKKVRCDLQTRQRNGFGKCSVCHNNGNTCQVREPRRENQRRNRINQEKRVPRTGRSGIVDDVNSDLANIAYHVMPEHDDGQNEEIRFQDVSHASPQLDRQQRAATSVSHPESSRAIQVSRQSAREDSHNTSETRNMSGYIVDTGFLNVYRPENEHDATRQAALLQTPLATDSPIRSDLLQSFAETYFEYCYPWCPVVDKANLFSELHKSPLLAEAVALAASHVQPPIFAKDDPEVYYDRARRRFYDDEEAEVLMSLRAISLFYWWSPRSPTAVHRHSSWWWTSVIIRHAQQMGIHGESAERFAVDPDGGIKKRLWWTVFARERLTAVCQGKPCIIDPSDCTIPPPSLDDFPKDCDARHAQIFIDWVKLCGVIGTIAKYLARATSTQDIAELSHPGRELIEWINNLPEDLSLSIREERSVGFDRNVHQLYLPYLAVVIVLHLKRSGENLPSISPTAIMAATCIARIFRDLLIRGGVRFLMAISCWYCATAYIVLSQASKQEDLRKDAEEELDVLYATMKELQKMWGTADVFEQGFRRIRDNIRQTDHGPAAPSSLFAVPEAPGIDQGDMNWLEYFPFATAQTSPIAATLLADYDKTQYHFADFSEDLLNLRYPDLFESFDQFNTNPLFASG